MGHPTPKDVYKLLGVRVAGGPTPKDVDKLVGGSERPHPKECVDTLGELQGLGPAQSGKMWEFEVA